MKQAAIISTINLLLVVAIFTEAPPLGWILLAFWSMSFFGALGFHYTKKKAFAIISYIGFGLFIPLGMIGIYGVKKMSETQELGEMSPNESPNRIFLYNQKYAKLYLLLGITSILFEFAQRFFLGRSVGLTGAIGGIMIIMYFLFKKMPVLQVFREHFILKIAPMSSIKIVNFSDIQRSESSRKQALLWLNSEPKPVKIPWQVFNDKERDEVGDLLKPPAITKS